MNPNDRTGIQKQLGILAVPDDDKDILNANDARLLAETLNSLGKKANSLQFLGELEDALDALGKELLECLPTVLNTSKDDWDEDDDYQWQDC